MANNKSDQAQGTEKDSTQDFREKVKAERMSEYTRFYNIYSEEKYDALLDYEVQLAKFDEAMKVKLRDEDEALKKDFQSLVDEVIHISGTFNEGGIRRGGWLQLLEIEDIKSLTAVLKTSTALMLAVDDDAKQKALSKFEAQSETFNKKFNSLSEAENRFPPFLLIRFIVGVVAFIAGAVFGAGRKTLDYGMKWMNDVALAWKDRRVVTQKMCVIASKIRDALPPPPEAGIEMKGPK